MPDSLDTFAANLRRLRRERGWSQETLALESGLGMGHVSKIDRGECSPGVRTVSKLACGLGVSAADLFDGIDGREGA
jgi:transcriptional regulator with XRE-family HTH domain